MKRHLKRSSPAPLQRNVQVGGSSKPLKRTSEKRPLSKPGDDVKKRSLSRKPVVPPKPTTGPIPIVPKSWRWRGKKHPTKVFEGRIIVVPDAMPESYPRPFSKMLPETFWQVEKKTGKVEQLITVMPDGTVVGWLSCYGCHNIASRCVCNNGFVHSRGIEWIYVSTLLRTEDGMLLAERERLHSQSPEVRQHGIFHYLPKETGVVLTGEQPRRPVAGRTMTRKPAGSDSVASGKRSLTRRTPDLDVGRNYDTEAESKADQLTRTMTRKLSQNLSEAPKRTLKRK